MARNRFDRMGLVMEKKMTHPTPTVLALARDSLENIATLPSETYRDNARLETDREVIFARELIRLSDALRCTECSQCEKYVDALCAVKNLSNEDAVWQARKIAQTALDVAPPSSEEPR